MYILEYLIYIHTFFSGNIMGTNGTNGQHTNGRLSSTANGRLSSTANEVDEDDFDPDDLGGETGVEEILAQDRDYNQFDEIIGCIEDIVIEQQFQDLQESFLEKHYHHFDIGTEENKLIYMEIFQVRFMNL